MQMALMAADGQTELPHGFSGPRTEWLDARQLQMAAGVARSCRRASLPSLANHDGNAPLHLTNPKHNTEMTPFDLTQAVARLDCAL